MRLTPIRLPPDWLLTIGRNPALKNAYKMFVSQAVPEDSEEFFK